MKAIKPKFDLNLQLKAMEYIINIPERKIYLQEELTLFDPTDIDMKISMITNYTNDFKSPIKLCVTCLGGDVYGMFGVIDVMRASPVPIYTYGVGTIMSAASVILACGAKNHRYMTKNSTLMIHEISTWSSGTTANILVEANQTKQLQKKLLTTLAENSKMPVSFWEKKSKMNFYLTPEECLEYGLIDKII